MMAGSFRRSVAVDTRKKSGRRGGYYDRYKLPKDVATPFILVKSEFPDPSPSVEFLEVDPATGRPKPPVLPYYKFRTHTRAIKQGGKEFYPKEVCSAGMDPHNPQPCAGCMAMDSGDKSVSVSDMFALTIVHLAYYHGHPLFDAANNTFVQKQGRPEYVNVYDECTGRTCNYCRAMAGQPPILRQGDDPFPMFPQGSITKVFGRRRYLEIGKSHLANLGGWEDIVKNNCGNCKRGLISDGFTCPYCQSMVIDLSNDPRTDEQIKEAVSKPYPCMRCNKSVLLNEAVSCDCGNAKQNSLYDVVLWGMRQGEQTKSSLVLQRSETMEEFSRTVDPQFLGGKSFFDYIAELAQPHEFSEILKPRAPHEQAQKLGLQNNQGGGSAPSMYGAPQQAPYGQYPQQSLPFQAPQPQQFQQPAQPQQQPQQGPGPAPFMPPNRPNFGS